MAHHTVVTLEKPLQHLALSDWNARVNQLRNVADARRSDAFNIRHSSRTLRNETRIEGDWTNYETNEALADRWADANTLILSTKYTFYIYQYCRISAVARNNCQNIRTNCAGNENVGGGEGFYRTGT